MVSQGVLILEMPCKCLGGDRGKAGICNKILGLTCKLDLNTFLI